MWQILSNSIVVDVVGGWKIRLQDEHRWQHRSLQGWRIWLCHKMQKPGKCDTPHSRTCHAWVFPWLEKQLRLRMRITTKGLAGQSRKISANKSQTLVRNFKWNQQNNISFRNKSSGFLRQTTSQKKTSRLHVTIPRFQQVLIGGVFQPQPAHGEQRWCKLLTTSPWV